jgi:hypothetical protein
MDPRLQRNVDNLSCLKSKSKLYYDRRSAGQSVLEQSTHLGLTTRSWLLSDSCGWTAWTTFCTLDIMDFFWLLFVFHLQSNPVFCRFLYSTNLLVNSLHEVGSGQTVWRAPPSTVELMRSLLLLCFGGSLSWISAFNQLKLHCAYQNSSIRRSIVDCVT